MSALGESCARILGAIAPSWKVEDRELAHRVADALRETPGARLATAEEGALLVRVTRMRRALDEATADFLRDVGRASREEGLSAEEYASLTQELERNKRAAVARSFATLLPPK